MTIVYILLALAPVLFVAGIYRTVATGDFSLIVIAGAFFAGSLMALVIIQDHKRDILRDKAKATCAPYVATIVEANHSEVSFACEGGRKAHLLQQIKN